MLHSRQCPLCTPSEMEACGRPGCQDPRVPAPKAPAAARMAAAGSNPSHTTSSNPLSAGHFDPLRGAPPSSPPCRWSNSTYSILWGRELSGRQLGTATRYGACPRCHSPPSRRSAPTAAYSGFASNAPNASAALKFPQTHLLPATAGTFSLPTPSDVWCALPAAPKILQC